jgi:photosystem II stability/assembly factor-like uncharacterized protein
MNFKIYFLMISLTLAFTVRAQFTPMDLPYNNQPYGNYPRWISIADGSTVWLGTLSMDDSGLVPYSYAIKTNNSGTTWEFDSIPAPGDAIMSSVCAVDANTCFYVFTDNSSGGSVWKTTDGGSSWTNKTTTQFTEPGAYADFYAAFDANAGVAVGDPTLGYFEIQRTTDGGNTWTRVDSALIPAIYPGEYGAANAFSVVGDNIWFPSLIDDGSGFFDARCFKSSDRGAHWTVSPVIANNLGWGGVDFSTAQKGVFWDPYFPLPRRQFYLTSDGGSTWAADSLSNTDKFIVGMTSVKGFDGGYVIAISDTTNFAVTLLFTPDFFSTTVVIDSNMEADPWALRFRDASTGWIGGEGADTNSIFKFTGLLTSIGEAAKSPEMLVIVPNPTSAESLVKLPALNVKGDLTIMIYNLAGVLLEKRPVESTTGWTKLNASAFDNGVYIVQVVSGDQVIAGTKWVVQH